MKTKNDSLLIGIMSRDAEQFNVYHLVIYVHRVPTRSPRQLRKVASNLSVSFFDDELVDELPSTADAISAKK